MHLIGFDPADARHPEQHRPHQAGEGHSHRRARLTGTFEPDANRSAVVELGSHVPGVTAQPRTDLAQRVVQIGADHGFTHG
ncbi:hypothetical protein JL106_14750 [Nakamurella sp. YIM 132084]|uniref:Uncharacterized protein n=1 Tax=Nakamurella leprariae TaxID=2803911 RepID=A0A938Y9J3_9ACTN|nr:hypothetical protein [Nakamurella leprariae]MBM9468541.1 hypothetical protein [Nakamurella leprariae]